MKMIVKDDEEEEEEGKRSKSNGRRVPVGSESTPNGLCCSLSFFFSTRMRQSCKLTRTYEISHFNYFFLYITEA